VLRIDYTPGLTEILTNTRIGVTAQPCNLEVTGEIRAAKYSGPRPQPSGTTGVYIGIDGMNNASIDLCSTADYPYIDFSLPNLDYFVRILGDPDTGHCDVLAPSGTLRVNGVAVATLGGSSFTGPVTSSASVSAPTARFGTAGFSLILSSALIPWV
jgi:hypothetical protein